MKHREGPPLFAAVAAVLFVAAEAAAGPAPRGPAPTFAHDIAPILRERCTVCHSASMIGNVPFSGGLALDSYAASIKGATGARPHAIIVPGRSGESILVKRLLATSPTAMMPRGGPPLPAAQIALLRRWIDAGAPAGSEPAAVAVHLSSPDSAPLPPDPAIADVVYRTRIKPSADMVGKGSKDVNVDFALQAGPLSPITALAYSPDGRQLAVGAYRSVIVWDTATGRPLGAVTQLAGPVLSLAYRRDGAQLAIAGGVPGMIGEVTVVDTKTWATAGRLNGHTDAVYSVAWDSKGGLLATAGQDKTARLWEWPSGRELRQFKDHADAVTSIAFSPDDKSIYTASQDHSVRRFEAATGKLVRQFTGHNEGVTALAVRPDGQRIVTAGTEPALHWWNTEDGSTTNNNGGHGGPVNAIVFSKDGKFVASASADGTVRVWDGGSTGQQRSLDGASDWLFSVAISPDDRFTAGGAADGVVRVWETATGRLRLSLIGWPPTTHAPEILWAAVTPEGFYDASPAWAARFRLLYGGKAVEGRLSAFTKSLLAPLSVLKSWQCVALEPAVIPAPAAAPGSVPAVTAPKIAVVKPGAAKPAVVKQAVPTPTVPKR